MKKYLKMPMNDLLMEFYCRHRWNTTRKIENALNIRIPYVIDRFLEKFSYWNNNGFVKAVEEYLRVHSTLEWRLQSPAYEYIIATCPECPGIIMFKLRDMEINFLLNSGDTTLTHEIEVRTDIPNTGFKYVFQCATQDYVDDQRKMDVYFHWMDFN